MPLPQSQTFYTDNNSAWTDVTTSTRMLASMVLSVQQALCGTILNTNAPGSSFWTIDYSCDGTTAGTAGDGVNRWTDATKVIRASGAVAHSWMVLKHTTLGVWLLIQYNGTNDYNWKLFLAKNAFTGGSTTVAPTSTSGTQCEVVTFWSSSDVTAAAGKISKTVDASGYWHLLLGKTGVGKVGLSVGFQPVAEPVSGDTWPFVLWCDWGSTTNPPLMSSQNNWRNASTRAMISRNNTATTSCAMAPLDLCHSTSAGTSFLTLVSDVDHADGKHIDYPVYLGIVQGATTYSHKGLLKDFRWTAWTASSTHLSQNTMAENSSGTPTHLLVGSTWVPWNTQPTW